MANAEKYEWINAPQQAAGYPSRDQGLDCRVAQSRARHQRLDREVSVTTVRRLNGNPGQRQEALLHTLGTNLAKLDHAAIPFLIDFTQDDEFIHFVFESFPMPLDLQALDPFHRLQALEQLCEALLHAQQCVIYHGQLEPSMLRADSEGQLKLVGLGIQQIQAACSANSPPSSTNSDIATLLGWLRQTTDSLARSEDQAPPVAALRAILQRQDREDLSALQADLSHWIEQEIARRESEKLNFEDAGDNPEPPRSSKTTLFLVASTTACLAVGLALLFAFWPRESEVARQPSRDPATAKAHDGEAGGVVDVGEAQSPLPTEPKPFASDLASVGKLNNAGRAPGPDENEAPAAESSTGTADDSPASTSSNPLDTAAVMTESAGTETTTTTESELYLDSDSNVAKNTEPESLAPSPSPTIEKPFADVSLSVSLPTVDTTEATVLVETPLPFTETIELTLVGGTGAHPSNAFELTSSSDQAWALRTDQQTVAELTFDAGKLFFQWEVTDETREVAPYAANTALLLAYGDTRHLLALRQSERRPKIHVQLEPRRGAQDYKINLTFPPDPKGVMLEFVLDNDSLAVALPKATIGVVDEMMRIGLDAGKKSLFVLEVEPDFGARRQTLNMRATMRTSIDQKQFIPITSKNLKDLRDLRHGLTVGIPQLEARKQVVKGDNKKIFDLQIKQAEENKKRLELFFESYQLAARTELQFRLYRQVGSHRIPLIAWEGENQ